ncbi:hypothetical protein CASFOL_019003 [Castilleja foliolosa]|uniref:Uncharacterized protein n=1 Tax=Castilleja foliolosa TaxID=1961234 RepID=A0ABD3D4G2_9LAMI
MKLLGWMHRKLMQNSTEPIKNYTIGNHPTCFSIQTQSDKRNYYIDTPKTSSHSNITCEEESFDEPFDFLSIGTFGMELLNTDPPTPTLPMPIVPLTDQDQQPIEITENDLNLINYELEKFIEAEEIQTGNDSSERSSQASVITLTDQGHMQMVACPLRNYLFAASVELAETDKEVKKTRTSLEELFKRNNIVNDDPSMKKLEKVVEHDAKKGKNVAHFMKKAVKRFNPASNFDDDGDDESNPIKKKLSKTLVKMFHKKVYPEEMAEKRCFKELNHNKKKKNISNQDDHHIENIKLSTKKSKKNTMKIFLTGICKGASPENTGHWIKTDSECKLGLGAVVAKRLKAKTRSPHPLQVSMCSLLKSFACSV